MLSRATGQRIHFSDLGNEPLLSALESMHAASEYKSFVAGAVSSQLATFSDLELVRSITALDMTDQAALSIVPARDFRIRDLNSSNSILVGYSLSNPWVDVFHDAFNFVLDRDRNTDTLSITNLHPKDGEPQQYRLGNPRTANPSQGFSTVAFVPNLAHSGNVLIISGADVPGTEAAICFLTTGSFWDPFYREIAAKGHIPSFEVVLAYHRFSKSFGDVTPIAFRLH
jgi:hypothetical protein